MKLFKQSDIELHRSILCHLEMVLPEHTLSLMTSNASVTLFDLMVLWNEAPVFEKFKYERSIIEECLFLNS